MSLGSSTYYPDLTINTQKKTITTDIYIVDDKPTFESAFGETQDCRIVLRKNPNAFFCPICRFGRKYFLPLTCAGMRNTRTERYHHLV